MVPGDGDAFTPATEWEFFQATPLALAALRYVDMGLPITPLIPGTAELLYDMPVRDIAKVRDIWTYYPDANIGIITGYVVDVININSRAAWKDVPRGLRIIGHALTPRPDGHHLYIDTSGGGSRCIAKDLHYRGPRRWVVAPPSVLKQKPRSRFAGRYQWARELSMGHRFQGVTQ